MPGERRSDNSAPQGRPNLARRFRVGYETQVNAASVERRFQIAAPEGLLIARRVLWKWDKPGLARDGTS